MCVALLTYLPLVRWRSSPPPFVARAAMPAADEAYSIRPSFKEKFRPAAVKSLISAVLSERLQDKTCAAPSEPRALVQATLSRAPLHLQV